MKPYVILDIETVVDWHFLHECETQFAETREQTFDRVKDKIRKQKNLPADAEVFIPAKYHRPVVVVMFLTDARGCVTHYKVLSGDSSLIVHEFWELMFDAVASGVSTICSFNGRAFDMPVMEAGAHRCQRQLPGWLVMCPKWSSEDPRSAYNPAHLDLAAFFAGSNREGSALWASLDYWCKAVGLPGKICMDGGDVEKVLEEDGGLEKIRSYCLADVLSTYGLFLHAQYMVGENGLPNPDGSPPVNLYWQLNEFLTRLHAEGWMKEGCVRLWAEALQRSQTVNGRIRGSMLSDGDVPF